MSKIKLAAALGLALMTSACVTQAEIRAADEQRCRNYGFRTGTDAYASCLLEVDLDRAADRRYRFDSFGAAPWPYGRRW